MRLVALLVLVCGCASAFQILNGAGTLPWSYNATGVSLDAVNWASAVYNDSAWASGMGAFGYGVTTTTKVSYGSSSSAKNPTTYFRAKVNVTVAPSTLTAAVFGLQASDGGVVYVNGVEVARFNMGPNPRVVYTDLALATVATTYGMEYYSFNPAVLVQGVNVLAVEVHKANVTAANLLFDSYLLLSTTTVVPYLTVPPYSQFQSSSSAIVRWTTSVGCGSTVYYSTVQGVPVRSNATVQTHDEHVPCAAPDGTAGCGCPFLQVS